MYKRFKILLFTFMVITGLLVLRVGYIQLAGHDDLAAVARAQQNITLDGADTRGKIYDRNGTPIAGGNQEYIYIIKSENYDGETQNALNEVYAEEVPGNNGGYKVFTSKIYRKSVGNRLIQNSGTYILEADRRYRDDQPAVHMVGYVNPKDNQGVSGLELMYNDELSMLNKKVAAVADVNGTLLQGYGLTVESSDEVDESVKPGITTTLELGLQQEAERVLSAVEKDGAVIVMKAGTGEILASASTPVFSPSEIELYMDSNKGELINKVTQGIYPPGSVFKIVVAAAALEAGVDPEKNFECSGSVTVNGRKVKCETGGDQGHGKITFRQAFAESCNCAFIKLGQNIGASAIIEMAYRLGLGECVLEGFPEEQKGNVMTEENAKGAAIANLSIGQGEMLVTPLQVAAMTAIVANDGVDTGTHLISDEKTDESRCITESVANQLKSMMEDAAEYGTGEDLELPVTAGVKTGSAESIQSGHEVIHGWITGYVPATDPEYVISVFVEDGRSGRCSAGPLFAEIVEYIYDMNLFENEIVF